MYTSSLVREAETLLVPGFGRPEVRDVDDAVAEALDRRRRFLERDALPEPGAVFPGIQGAAPGWGDGGRPVHAVHDLDRQPVRVMELRHVAAAGQFAGPDLGIVDRGNALEVARAQGFEAEGQESRFTLLGDVDEPTRVGTAGEERAVVAFRQEAEIVEKPLLAVEVGDAEAHVEDVCDAGHVRCPRGCGTLARVGPECGLTPGPSVRAGR